MELKAENAFLKRRLFGDSPDVAMEAETRTPEVAPPQSMGGFMPRSALAKSIRIKLADRRREAKAK